MNLGNPTKFFADLDHAGAFIRDLLDQGYTMEQLQGFMAELE